MQMYALLLCFLVFSFLFSAESEIQGLTLGTVCYHWDVTPHSSILFAPRSTTEGGESLLKYKKEVKHIIY